MDKACFAGFGYCRRIRFFLFNWDDRVVFTIICDGSKTDNSISTRWRFKNNRVFGFVSDGLTTAGYDDRADVGVNRTVGAVEDDFMIIALHVRQIMRSYGMGWRNYRQFDILIWSR